jgi:hypothetical protein
MTSIDIGFLLVSAIFLATAAKALHAIPDWPMKLSENRFSDAPYTLLDKVLFCFGAIGMSAFATVAGSVAGRSLVENFASMSCLGFSGVICVFALRMRRVVRNDGSAH